MNKPPWSGRPRKSIGILVDRSIPAEFADALNKFVGMHARSLAAMYGDQVAMQLEDKDFLADAGSHGWVVFTSNPKMYSVDVERQAVIDNNTKVFSLARTYTKHVQGLVYGRHLLSVRRRCREPGPCFWTLSSNDQITKQIK